MLTVEIDTLLPTRLGLRCGMTVRYGKDGPVRFVQAHMPWNTLTWHVRQEIMECLATYDEREIEEDVALF